MHKQDPMHDIIAEFKRGDQPALDYLFRLYYNALCFFAERLIQDRPAAEDIVTDTFMKLWERHTDFETQLNIKAFLYITTRNACLNFLKQVQRHANSKNELAYLSAQDEDHTLNEIIRTEVLQELYEEIENLPTQCRKIFKMSYQHGLKNHEIAEKLQISPNTVKNQKVRAIQLLRVRLLKRNLFILLLMCPWLLELFSKN